MTSPAQCLQVFKAIIVAILILVMNEQFGFRPATLARGLAKASIGLDSASPHRVPFCGMFMLSTYRSVVTSKRTMATSQLAAQRNLIWCPAKVASKCHAVLIPAPGLFSVGSVSAFDGTEKALPFF